MSVLILADAVCALVLLVLSCFFYWKKNVSPAGKMTFISTLLLILALVLRAIYLRRLPLTSGADFILWFCSVTMFFSCIASYRRDSDTSFYLCIISSILMLIMLLLMSSQLASSPALSPLLKSPLLVVHVLFAVIAYSLFAFSAAVSAISLKKKETGRLLFVVRLVRFGFITLTLTIVLGAVWAEEAWGSYWSWDPKETWALITWLIYAFILHQYKRIKEKNVHILVLAGFAVSIFTFLGVNYLLPGLHTYANAN